MPGPAATVGSMHTCPMLNPGTPPPPHVGGPVTGPGVPTVLIGNKPAAVMGDMCTCAGPPDTIVQGEATVLIGGKPAATMGSMTAHGGSITQGEPTVLIGTGGSATTAVMPIKKIPFPKISATMKALAAVSGRKKQLDKAIANQEALKKEAENTEGEPKVYGVQWIKDDIVVKDSKTLKQITLRANVLNIEDGQSATINITKPVETKDEEGNIIIKDEKVTSLSGTVKDKMVEVIWEVEENTEENEDSSNTVS